MSLVFLTYDLFKMLMTLLKHTFQNCSCYKQNNVFLGLNPNRNPNPAHKALNLHSNPNPDSDLHITGGHTMTPLLVEFADGQIYIELAPYSYTLIQCSYPTGQGHIL